MSFTDVDIANATKFAESNIIIKIINRAYEKRSNLIGELNYTVRPATNSDYFIPDKLKNVSFVVDTHIPEKLCRMLSCNPAKNDGMCNPNSQPEIYRLGDTGEWDVHCQPACFRTAQKATYDESGSRAPDTPMLNFHNNECHMVPSTMVSYLEKPFFRSNIKYEIRKNDMPTGFSRIKSDNIYGSGLDYTTNATYCSYYDRTLKSDGSCSYEWWEELLDAVVGMSMINAIKSGIRMLINNNNRPFDIPTGLPSLPTELPIELTTEGWLNNRNSDFILPEVIMMGELVPPQPKATYNNNEDDDITKHRGKRFVNSNVVENHNAKTSKYKMPQMKKLYHITGAVSKTAKPLGVTWDDVGKTLSDILLGLLEAITTDPNIWRDIIVGGVSDMVLDGIKKMCTQLAEQLAKYTGAELIKIGGNIGSKVLGGALKSISLRLLVGNAVRLASKLAIQLAKFAAAAASVIGWILIGAIFIDLLFTFWDPFGYGEMFPASLPHDLMYNSELAFRQTLESTKAVYDFESLYSLILTPDEIASIQISSLYDRLIYLDALTVNSEGTLIDKGDNIDLTNLNKNVVDEATTQAMAKRVRFNAADYEAYNKSFINHAKMNNNILYVTGALYATSLLLFAIKFYILALFLIIICVISAACLRYFIIDDIFLINDADSIANNKI